MISPCTGCSAPCCRDYLITITSFDVQRILDNSKLKVEDFAELAPAKLLNLNDELVLECYEDGLRYDYVLALKSHPCTFLDEKNKCTIHSFAPYICRTYPYNSAKRLIGRARCNFFQKAAFAVSGVEISSTEYSEQISAYIELVREWNKRHGKKEECLDFLIKNSR